MACGVVTDLRMLEHYCLWDNEHIERTDRLQECVERVKTAGLYDECVQLRPADVTDEALLAVHSGDHVRRMAATATAGSADALRAAAKLYDDVYVNAATYDCARLAAGSSVALVDAIIDNVVRCGFAFVRPPGHHALPDRACGFCFFNNVAVAAAHALRRQRQRILIVDFDVHHGNGTQHMFYNDPRVLYFSVHRYEFGRFWPQLKQADIDALGGADARGFNINVPLNEIGQSEASYLQIFYRILLPVALEFQPDLVLVSAGFDAAVGCPEGEMCVSPAGYAHMVHMLKALAGGQVALFLEGGYCIDSLAESAVSCLSVLLGRPPPPCPVLDWSVPLSLQATLLELVKFLRPYWRCMECLADAWHEEAVLKLISAAKEGAVVGNYRDELYTELLGMTVFPLTDEPESLYYSADTVTKARQKISDALRPPPPAAVASVVLCYSAEMEQHRNTWDRSHPERPERHAKIVELLQQRGFTQRCVLLKPRRATDDELQLIHADTYVADMKLTATMNEKQLKKLAFSFDSVFLSAASYDCALLACGSMLEVVDNVLRPDGDRAASGVAVVRPPGHHAEHDSACGFCLFNTVAVAARYAVQRHHLQRVLVLDWDIHHGNGTQHAFYDDPCVMYISIHLFLNGRFFPQKPDANSDYVGEAGGCGFNMNIAWNDIGMGDGDYLAAFEQLIMPAALEFNPQLVLVSCGFDAARGDPLGSCTVSPSGYALMTHLLRSLAGGRVCLALEGGYNLTSISESMCAVVGALLGDAIELEPATTSASGVASIVDTIRHHRPFWRSLWIAEAFALEAASADVDLAAQLEILTVAPAASVPTLADSHESAAVVPLSWCPHLDGVRAVGADFRPADHCSLCDERFENWLCLACHAVFCGRFVAGHMVMHNLDATHQLALSLADLSVWCYACDSYVDNAALYQVRNHFHLLKFAQPLPTH